MYFVKTCKLGFKQYILFFLYAEKKTFFYEGGVMVGVCYGVRFQLKIYPLPFEPPNVAAKPGLRFMVFKSKAAFVLSPSLFERF